MKILNINSFYEKIIKSLCQLKIRLKNLANVILKTINSLGINPNYMIGQGYDGVAAMSGHFNGLQIILFEKYIQ